MSIGKNIKIAYNIYSMYNFCAPWHPLKKTILGRTYDPIFYEDVKNHKIRDILQRIAYETNEDFDNIQKILQSFGVEVIRPSMHGPRSIFEHVSVNGRLDYSNTKSYTLIPRPPMQPRDSILIVGDSAISTNAESFVFDPAITERAELQFDAPYVTVVGDRLIVDCKDTPGLDLYIKSRFPEHETTAVHIGGHNDAVFSAICPGAIVSSYHHTNYKDTFPGWKVCHVANQSWNAIPEWRKLKHSNQGKWWLPGEENNKEFISFVETWMGHWMGMVEETVFDVNLLMLDERTAMVNCHNQQVFDFFRQQGITPVVAPFRHRFFWDGGIHCITQDLYREGTVERYITTN